MIAPGPRPGSRSSGAAPGGAALRRRECGPVWTGREPRARGEQEGERLAARGIAKGVHVSPPVNMSSSERMKCEGSGDSLSPAGVLRGRVAPEKLIRPAIPGGAALLREESAEWAASRGLAASVLE